MISSCSFSFKPALCISAALNPSKIEAVGDMSVEEHRSEMSDGTEKRKSVNFGAFLGASHILNSSIVGF